MRGGGSLRHHVFGCTHAIAITRTRSRITRRAALKFTKSNERRHPRPSRRTSSDAKNLPLAATNPPRAFEFSLNAEAHEVWNSVGNGIVKFVIGERRDRSIRARSISGARSDSSGSPEHHSGHGTRSQSSESAAAIHRASRRFVPEKLLVPGFARHEGSVYFAAAMGFARLRSEERDQCRYRHRDGVRRRYRPRDPACAQ